MRSSRRSSRSAHTARQPAWRAPSAGKNSATASVSLVFAEPEHGAPLTSASHAIVSTQLDTHSNDNASISSRNVTPKQSIMSLRMSQRERDEPQNAVASGSGVQNADSPDSSCNSTLPEVVEDTESRPSTAFVAPAKDHSVATGAPTITSHSTSSPPLFASPPASPSKKSWFGTLSRTKGGKSPSKLNIVQTVHDPQSGQDVPALGVINLNQDDYSSTSLGVTRADTAAEPEQPIHTTPSLPRPIASSAPATSGAGVPPSPIPTSPIPPQPAGTIHIVSHSPSPPPIIITSPRSVPKSGTMSPPASIAKAKEPSSPPIGEEVPVVDLSTELPPPVSVSPSNGASPNASSSRFTLNIPFLGRSKGSSEDAVRMDTKGPFLTQSSAIRDTDLSLPQPITVELFADAAQDSLQDAMAHSSEAPSIPAEEMETSKDQGTEHSAPQSSANTATEEQAPPVAQSQADATWWAYLRWSAAPAPSNPAPSTSPHGTAAMSLPPSELALRQSDSRSETVATNPNPLVSTARTSDAISGISPTTTHTTPSTAPADSQKATGHASETAEGSTMVPTQLTMSNHNDVSKASELKPLPRSLVLQDRSSEEARQQQLESAEQPGAAASSSDGPPAPSWFSPWSWYSQPSGQVAVGPSDGVNNEECGMEKAGSPDPAGLVVDERERALRDDMYPKRTGMEESDGGHQSVVGVGVGAMEEQSLEVSKNDQRANADNGTDVAAEVTVPADQVANPIEQSITAYRSGWASLFSSRKLIVKTLGYSPARSEELGDVKRDENGMEIMEVDFDEDAMSAEGSQGNDQKQSRLDGVVNGQVVKNEETGKKGVKAAVGSSTGVSSAQTSQDGVAKPSPQPTIPPTTADDIKETTQSNPASDRKGKSVPTSKSGSGPTTPILRPSTPTGKAVPLPSSPSLATSPAGNTRDRKRTASPAPSSKKGPVPPNLVLPTWEDTFLMPPRSVIPPSAAISQGDDRITGGKLLGRAVGFVSSVLFSKDGTASGSAGNKSRLGSGAGGEDHQEHLSAAEKERKEKFLHFGMELPRALDVIESPVEDPMTSRSGVSCSPYKATSQTIRHFAGRFMAMDADKDKDGELGPDERACVRDVLRGCRRVVVIGIHGWFPGAVVRTVLGEPTGTSGKFVDMMVQALENFQEEHSVSLDKVTRIPLEGEGTIERRVEKLYSNLIANSEWMDDMHAADAIFIATHSQGSVVSTHLLNRLINDRHIHTSKDSQVLSPEVFFPGTTSMSIALAPKPQRVCCLALCGIHLGPLRYLSSSTFFQPYLQYFESSAARELFEFQNTDSAVSKSYVNALRHVLNNGVKMVYVASLNDQVVPIYSGLFTAISHPLILRALYIDGDAYHSSDFLSKLLVLLLRILNSGISDSGLLAHLSEATAGSLNGVGHSTAYEEIATYALAVKYLFSTNDGLADHAEAGLESFNAGHEQNDYEIPWALRDVIANERVTHFFATEISELRDAFRDWHPKTTILRDLKRKLQPIQRLPSTFSSQGSTSKL
ncbi:hypothetical protein P691DRAFT_803264 [Macrolepiota fuliginosa MF-IS2]|uniref:YMC020W-like alpha/beta hydrolase domain-containing protein n=1 Tax=Macrolepiota fuliginosa MF-IS2 TaxID=1400762 RepID=A0A9P6C0S7_9AGAR|nr:hypothetical protein P691DRAFT_803264 [Macrolepiota fuliginosa MF-IS2]